MTCGGRIERIRLITHCAGNQSALAIVADSSPTRPPDGDIAGLGELKQVLVLCVPSEDEAATREGDLRPLARESDGRMNWARRSSGYTRRHGFLRAKNFLMYVGGADAPGSKTSA